MQPSVQPRDRRAFASVVGHASHNGPVRVTACSSINIAALLAGELTPDERNVAEHYLDGCADCRRIAVALAVPTSRSLAPRLCVGARVDQYVVEAFLGAGGMGAVYSARDEDLGRRVALKVLDAEIVIARPGRWEAWAGGQPRRPRSHQGPESAG